MPYRIEFSPSAAREFKKLPAGVQSSLAAAIDALVNEPRPSGVVKLTGQEDLYRIREGNFRVVYQIQDSVLLVLVVGVGDRKQICRRFR